jgi:hypothetical protein
MHEPATADHEVDRRRHTEAFARGLPEEIARVGASRSELHQLAEHKLAGRLRIESVGSIELHAQSQKLKRFVPLSLAGA